MVSNFISTTLNKTQFKKRLFLLAHKALSEISWSVNYFSSFTFTTFLYLLTTTDKCAVPLTLHQWLYVGSIRKQFSISFYFSFGFSKMFQFEINLVFILIQEFFTIPNTTVILILKFWISIYEILKTTRQTILLYINN